MKQEVYVENAEITPPSLTRRVSWGAIFAGFFVTMVTQLTLTLLGAAIGIASLEPFREPHSGQKCRSIGFPLPPALVNVFMVPSIVNVSFDT